MTISSEAFDEIRHLRVSVENPVTSTNENLDFERCAALHNAIIKHAWIAGGRDRADIPARSIWNTETIPQGAQERLHPDLIEFLKRCLMLDRDSIYNFFHFVVDLNNSKNLWEWLEGIDEDYIALYISNDSSSLTGTGIIYDQSDHSCKFDGPCHDGEPDDAPTQWHRLETILSAWLDLIERGKIVALHHSVANIDQQGPNPNIPLVEEATGARQEWSDQYPWTSVPFARQDLSDTLSSWHNLISAISSKLPEPKVQPFNGRGLFSQDTLEAAGIHKDSFAWSFFTNAWKPSFGQIGPGLRIATDNHFINNPWKTAQGEIDLLGRDPKFPVPVLVGSNLIKSWECGPRGITHQIPWGLYLEQSGFHQNFPVEDGCRLALPYPVGANGLALRSDGTPLNPENGAFELYQLGRHPYVPCHGTQLYMVLDGFARSVAEGLWKVGADGVDEPDTIFQDADTEAGSGHYRVYV